MLAAHAENYGFRFLFDRHVVVQHRRMIIKGLLLYRLEDNEAHRGQQQGGYSNLLMRYRLENTYGAYGLFRFLNYR